MSSATSQNLPVPASSAAAAPAASPAAADRAVTAPLRTHRRRLTWWFAIAAIVVVALPLAANALFTGAFSNVSTTLDKVPAALVNNDKMITTTAADGTQSTVFAGRGLMTELTGAGQNGFDWKVTNTADAEKGLADGTYYAVLTIPSNFSEQVSSLGTATPVQSSVSIATDNAHGYLAGVVAGTVGSAITSGFGQTVTSQVLGGVYSGFGTIGTQLTSAADGAGKLADGAGTLTSGLNQLASGASSAATGATTLSDGVTKYTDGVDSLASGIGTLDSQAGQLSALSSGVSQYTDGISQLSGGFDQLSPALSGAIQSNPNLTDVQKQELLGAYAGLTGGLSKAAASGSTLSGSTSSGLDALQSGIGQLASGANQLSAGSAQLRSGTSDLANGLTPLATGAQQSAAGAEALQSGAAQLQTGLSTGASSLASSTATDTGAAAKVVADPIAVTVTTANSGGGIGQVIAILLVPAGLWIGALAVFVFLRPLRQAVLASSASTARLIGRVFGRASILGVVQALLLVAYLHVSLDAAWSLLPATLGFTLLVTLAFTAFHQFLTTAFGRIGTIVSLVLFAVQMATTAGVYPAQLLSGPFQTISAISPMAFAVSGIQGILAGGPAAPVWGSVVVLALLLLVSLLFTGFALGRRRNPLRTGWLTVGAHARDTTTNVRTASALRAEVV